MKRFFLIFLTCLILLLEVAFFTNVKIFGITPNIFLMFLLASSFIIPEQDIFYLAFFGSLFLDLFSPIIFGAQTIIILLILFLVFLTSRFLFTNVNFILLFLLATVSTILFDVLFGLVLFLSGLRVDVIFYARNSLVPQIIVNSLLALLFYPFVLLIWENISRFQSKARLLK